MAGRQMEAVRNRGAFWKWMLGLSTLLLTALGVLELQRGTAAVGRRADCNDIYQLLLRQHLSDDRWLKTHVLLNTADGSRFIVSDVERIRSRMNWFERLRYRCEFNSFLGQKDGEPLPYTAGNSGLGLISPSERKDTLKQGTSVLTFTLPGFGCDGREAVVFAITESQDSPLIAPFFSGSLIYLKKVGGTWVIDHPKGLPGINVVS